MELRVLPNIPKYRINFPHQTDSEGTHVQTKTIKTILRVGLVMPSHLEAGLPLHVRMSLHHSSGEITPTRLIQHGLWYIDLTSTEQELRTHGVEAGDAHIAEVTFSFRFNVTAEGKIHNCTKDSHLWLRFTLVEHSEIFVETPHFRLLARKAGTGHKRKGNIPAATPPPAALPTAPPPAATPPSLADLLNDAKQLQDKLQLAIPAAPDAIVADLRRMVVDMGTHCTMLTRHVNQPDPAAAPAPSQQQEDGGAASDTDGPPDSDGSCADELVGCIQHVASREPQEADLGLVDQWMNLEYFNSADGRASPPSAKRPCAGYEPTTAFRSLHDGDGDAGGEARPAYRSLGCEDGAFRGLGCDDGNEDGQQPRAVEPLSLQQFRATAKATLLAIVRDMRRRRREAGGGPQPGEEAVLREELADLKQWMLLHRSSSSLF